MQAPSLNSELVVDVEKLAVGGAGVTRHNGFVIFVDQACPGDKLKIKVTEVKRSFALGKIIEILSPGHGRRQAPCHVAGECGGCNWQHIEESVQRQQKELIVKDSLERILGAKNISLLPIVPSPRSLRYRNRIQPKMKGHEFGFFARDSHNIVSTKDCLITEEPLAEKLPEIQKWALAQTKDSSLRKLEAYISADHEIKYHFIDQDDDGIGFSQVNRFQNEQLIATALDWAQGQYSRLIDLYAGSGNFTFPLMQKFPRVPTWAVELNGKLVQRAREQSKSKDLNYVCSDIETFLRRFSLQNDDLVFLDPPRAGCSEYIMRSIALAQPKKVIYISCHPVALARDLKWLLSTPSPRPLSIKRIQPFEMFPQTDHVETIVELGVDS